MTVVSFIPRHRLIAAILLAACNAGAVTLSVTDTNDSGSGSLRQAILDANASSNVPDVIHFNIPGAGTHTITPGSPLPAILDTVSIDATSQPGFNSATGKPVIVLDGSAAGNDATAGLRVVESKADGTQIRGLQIVNFNSRGIEVNSVGGVRIAGCYLGTDGAKPLGNVGSGGLLVLGPTPDLVIGGTEREDRNVISGNSPNQIYVKDDQFGPTIVGNFIGVNAAGTAAFDVPSNFGISLQTSSNTIIGGNVRGSRNVISGCNVGISVLNSPNTTVSGNFIGTDAAGTNPVGNHFGVNLSGADTAGCIIGGNTAVERNLISGNDFGVYVLLGAHGNSVQGNYIGTDVSGQAKLANETVGVELGNGATQNLIGGQASGEGNVISGNAAGLTIGSAPANSVQGNLIGTAADGTSPLGNAKDGVLINSNSALTTDARENVIGGSDASFGNTIAFNGGAGVIIEPDEHSAFNAVRANSIYGNGGRGIDLAPGSTTGATPNDPGDNDSGPNGLQNSPVIHSATKPAGEPVNVDATLNSTPNTAFLVDFYGSDPGDLGGRIFLGTAKVTTDSKGTVNMLRSFDTAGAQEVTATATTMFSASAGDTSEFARPVQINAGGTVRFKQANFAVEENAGLATITVTRVDGSDGAASVKYQLSDGTAKHPGDYTGGLSVVHFAAGQTKATFTVAIKDDSIAEGDETIKLTLDGPVGAILGSPSEATLTIRASDQPAKLVNISTRLHVGAGDNQLFGGFIITGNEPKTFIARALGPSLPVSGKLANPKLEIFNSSQQSIAMNNNWKTAPNKQAIIDTQIAPSKGMESAVLKTIAPGSYTLVVSGVGAGTGIGAIEIYDLSASADAELANISSRGVVQTGDSVMIGGFILAGSAPRNVIVRALGPSLPLTGVLPNPLLELRDQNGEIVRSNDNWRSDQEAKINATGISPDNNLEAAVVESLNPGAYTAVVRDANGKTGIGLVEVYALQ